MPHFYLDPSRESELYALPDGLATYCEAGEMADHFMLDDCHEDDTPEDIAPAGYYVCACLPGCLPDSEWSGPFDTFEAAVSYWRDLFSD